MIFVDSNIPMYLIGASHPNKYKAASVIERLISENQKLVSSTEVIQEILHRYCYIKRLEAITPAIDTLYSFVEKIFSIEEDCILKAKDLVLSYKDISARDAIHIAVMKKQKCNKILTFDCDFLKVPGIQIVI